MKWLLMMANIATFLKECVLISNSKLQLGRSAVIFALAQQKKFFFYVAHIVIIKSERRL